MIEIDKTLVSEEILKKSFVCNLGKCKGACCIEGDYGAPLQADEITKLQDALEKIRGYLSQKGLVVLAEKGFWERDPDGDFVTTTYKGKECVFANYDESGALYCTIEQAQNDGATDVAKPISCHLYPIRLVEYEAFISLQYHQWDICTDACALGEELGVPVYRFLKESLIRRFGMDWYMALEAAAKYLGIED